MFFTFVIAQVKLKGDLCLKFHCILIDLQLHNYVLLAVFSLYIGINIILFLRSKKSLCFQTYMSKPSKNPFSSFQSLLPLPMFFNGSKHSLMFTCFRLFVNFKKPSAFNYHNICLISNIIIGYSLPNSQVYVEI